MADAGGGEGCGEVARGDEEGAEGGGAFVGTVGERQGAADEAGSIVDRQARRGVDANGVGIEDRNVGVSWVWTEGGDAAIAKGEGGVAFVGRKYVQRKRCASSGTVAATFDDGEGDGGVPASAIEDT